MFDEKFIDELFKKQPVYPQSSTREIFYKVAHSSIMRLSESSMEKVVVRSCFFFPTPHGVVSDCGSLSLLCLSLSLSSLCANSCTT